MSKSVGDLLRELDATTAWPKYPYNGTLRAAAEADRVMKALPLLAAVLDAADAMRDWTPVSYVPGLLPEPIEALRVEACATYDAACAALAEALKEGR